MKKSSRVWILLTLGMFLCASLLVAKTPEVPMVNSAGLAPRSHTPNPSTNQPMLPQLFRTDVAYAYNAYDPGSTYPEGPITFELETPGTITQLADQSGEEFIAGSSTDSNGTWWGIVYSETSTSDLVTINTETGARTVIGSVTAPGSRSWTGMAFDFDTMTMFAVCITSSTDMALCSIDLTNAEVTLIGTNTTSTFPIALACDNFGQLYAVDIASEGLYTIDKTNGSAQLVGTLDVSINYAQDMEFDHEDNTLYWAAYTSSGELRIINVADASTELVGAFPNGMEVTGLAIQSFPADPGAPAAPTNLAIIPDAGGVLSCALSWTNPSLDVSGETLTELTEIQILRDGTVVHTMNNPTIGADASWTDTGMSAPSMITYQVMGVNSNGDGIPASGNAWVGEDVPAAVTELVLTENNFNGRLTWTNPTTGMHGGPFNNPITGYRLVRSDGEVINVDGMMTMYDDTTIEFGGTYYYEVSAVNASGVGAPAVSNACAILTPGTMVYADFETGAMPEGWTEEFVSGSSSWIFQAGGYSGNPATAHSGDFNALLYVGNTNGDITRLVSPTFNITDGAVLSFWHTQPLWASDQDQMTLLYRNTPGGEWTEIQTWTESITNWTEEIFTLPNASTTYQIAFEGLAIFGYGIGIDDVIVSGEAGDVGTIEGTVTLDGGIGVITEVDVEAGGITVHPNQSGDYAVTVAVGTYDVTATLFGYADVVVEDVVVQTDQVTENVDITLVPNPNVTVTGRCIGSDHPDVGLSNVQVDITGYDTYQAFTNENGYFTIEGVWANHTYQITAMVEGYDIYVGEAVVGDDDTNLGDLILPEIASPPYNLVATQNDEGTEAYLIWRQPTGSLSSEFNFDSDDCDFVSSDTGGWQWGEDTVIGNVSEPNIWGTVLNADYLQDNLNWWLDSPEVMVATDQYQLTFWHYYETENSWDGGNVKISIDGGSTWEIITPVGGYPDDAAATSNAGIPGEPCYTAGPSGWVLATFELGAYVGEEVMFRWHFGTDTSGNTYYGWAIDDVRVGMPEERMALQQDGPSLRWVSNVANTRNRTLEEYNVYRLLLGEEDIEENWELVATEVMDTTYTDGSWNDAETNIYKYAVKAVYTNGIYSDATISDWLAKNYYTTCTVNVYSATGDPLDGTVVTLSCQDEDPDGDYPEYREVLADDVTTAYFPMVWLGTYDVRVMLQGSEPWEGVYTITSPTTIDVTITELTPPVGGLTGTVTGNDVTLMWRTPSPSSEFNFDDDNGEFVSNNANGWQWGEDTVIGNVSEPNIWGTVLNADYLQDNLNWWLDSPEVIVANDQYQLTFWHYYETESYYDGGNVKISIDGGSTWEIITPVGDYPEDAAATTNAGIPGEPCYTAGPSGWVLATFELGAYVGEVAMFRWHFGTDTSGNTYYGWAIDDVRVGMPQDRTRNENVISRKETTSRTSRSLEGYDVYRNGALIDDTLEPADTVFVDQDLSDGVYTYEVVANYTTGDSDPASVTVQVFPVSVTGYVTTSDNPEIGLDGALVVLQNDDFYFETFTVDGDFSFLDINGMQTYNLTITYESDVVFYETYEGVVVTEDADVNLGEITLVEMTPAPGQVVATENTEETEVTLVWGTPGSATPTEFRYDDGNIISQLGWGSSSEVRMGAAHYHDARIESITWYLTSEAAHSAADLYIYGLDDNGVPNSNDVLFSITGVPSVDDQWNTYDLEEPVDAPDGFYIGVNTPTAFLALGLDDGVDDPYAFQAGTQWITNTASTNVWTDLADTEFTFNFAIRANGLDYGELDRTYTRSANSFKKAIPEGVTFIPGYEMPMKNEARTIESSSKEISANATLNQRPLISYRVYRFEEEDINNEANWEWINEDDQPWTDTTFVDTGWASLESNTYQWAVIAEYTNVNLSEPSFSNPIDRSMFAQVYINFTTNSGDNPAGASVTFANQNGEEEYIYEATVPTTGTVYFPSVRLGFYNLSVELDGFDDYYETNMIVNDPTNGHEFDIELEEALVAVVVGDAVVDGGDVHLTWLPAGQGGGEEFSEDFEGGEIPTGWTTLDVDDDGYTWEIIDDTDMGAHTGTYAIGSASYINDIGALNPDNWLITPSISMGANSSMTYWVCAQDPEWPEEHYYVLLSTTGTNTSDFDEELREETLSDGDWHEITIDLGDYAGQSCYIAFNHCDVTDMYWMKIDDINITNARGEVISLGTRNDSREVSSKVIENQRDRSLLGYKIDRDDETLVELQNELEYWDMGLPSGSYTYKIYAVYTTGDAVPLEIPVVGNGQAPEPTYATELIGNHPNPFNPETKINFSLSSASHVTIDIYNIKGQRVRSLVNDKYDAGKYSITWQGTDDNNRKVGSGIYFYKMKGGRYTATKKMILLK